MRGTSKVPRTLIMKAEYQVQYNKPYNTMKKLPSWEHLLSQTHDLIRRERSECPPAPVEDVIREMREERDQKFLDLKGEKNADIIYSCRDASGTI